MCYIIGLETEKAATLGKNRYIVIMIDRNYIFLISDPTQCQSCLLLTK